MASATVIEPQSVIDPRDVQGLVRFGYGHHTEACYLLLRIQDAAAARSWCAGAPVATAEEVPNPPLTALQIAFTFSGLHKLGLPADLLAGFSAEFQSGMAGEPNRSLRLGDIGANAPDRWAWGSGDKAPDAVAMLFAFPGKLQSFSAEIQNGAFHAAFVVIHRLDTINLGGYEQFGFKDGVSQPQMDWQGTLDVSRWQIDYTNMAAAGEFLLGYSNEYGKYTDRPLADADARTAGLLPALDQPTKKDVGRNGTFVIIRTLQQDVRGFWKFLDGQTNSDARLRAELGEKMVGRTIDGNPLAPVSSTSIPGVPAGAQNDANRFTFDRDPAGTRCPLGAHIRRANPRNTDFPDRPTWWLPLVLSKLGFAPSQGFRGDIMASTRFHRLLRRGREYGAGKLTPEQAVQEPAPPPGSNDERGLHFVALAANINRQFEFIQNAWLMSTKFDGLTGESDPLLGNRTPIGDGCSTDNFTVPREQGLARSISGLPQFITVRGGAYFFLPGISALRYLSSLGEPTQTKQGVA